MEMTHYRLFKIKKTRVRFFALTGSEWPRP